MKQPTVFLAQEPQPRNTSNGPVLKDLSGAARFGRVLPVFSQTDNPSMEPNVALVTAFEFFERHGFDPEIDYLCYAGGDPLSMPLVMLALQNHGIPSVSFLRWERDRDSVGNRTGRGFYVPVRINLE